MDVIETGVSWKGSNFNFNLYSIQTSSWSFNFHKGYRVVIILVLIYGMMHRMSLMELVFSFPLPPIAVSTDTNCQTKSLHPYEAHIWRLLGRSSKLSEIIRRLASRHKG